MSDKPSSWLITGATGFLGRHVIGTLRETDPGARIVALVRHQPAGAYMDYLDDVELIEGSILETEAWSGDQRLQGIGGVFHLAAEVKHSRHETGPMMRLNVDGTISLMRLAARKRWRVLFASTSGTVGCSENSGDAPDEHAPHCTKVVSGWPYYMSKIRAETDARAIAEETGLDLVIVRPPVLLGPGDHRYRSTSNVLRLMEGRLPFILDGGMHFTDVRDAAHAMVGAMTHPHPQPVYNLPGTASTLDEFFRLVARHADIEPTWKTLPRRLLWYAARINEVVGRPLRVLPDPVVIEMAGHHWGISSRYAAQDLGYRPRQPGQTIADTIDWIRRETSLRESSG